MIFVARPLFATVLFFASAGQTFGTESLEQTIAYLINYVGDSKATFVRNGVSHTPAGAAKHIQAKYEHFKKEIKKPEDFIRLATSKSLLTGKPYLVRMPDGEEVHLDAWLSEALKAHRAQLAR